MALSPLRRTLIKQIFEEFLRNRARSIRRLKIENLDINPFLIHLLAEELNLKEPGSIVRWLVTQRLERGTVTSFGITLQKVAKVFSEGTAVEGADILKIKNGRHYHIQVKSGPNAIPKDLGVRISQLLRSAQRRNEGSVALYGMCYGSKKQVSSIVRKYVQEEGGINWITGKEFWEFISDDPNCIDEIYEIAAEVSKTFKDKKGQTLSQILENKIRELESQFEGLYCSADNAMWRAILEHNS